MDKQFWLERWALNEIGFHQPDVHSWLEKFWPVIKASPGSGKTLVPLCGKSFDLRWLAGRGHEVLGVELSPQAVKDFFVEQGLAFQQEHSGAFERYRSRAIELLCGDFFDLTAAHLADVGAVYDRAALIAMPDLLQQHYASHLLELLPQRPPILLITLEYDQDQMSGPPFSTPESRVEELFADAYRIECLVAEDILERYPNFQSRGLARLVEAAYRLTGRESQ